MILMLLCVKVIFLIQECNFGMLLKGNADHSCRADAIDQADDSTEPADTPSILISDLHIKYAHLISKLEKQLAYHPEFPCCSCEQLKLRD